MNADEILTMRPNESVCIITGKYPIKLEKTKQFELFPGITKEYRISQKDYRSVLVVAEQKAAAEQKAEAKDKKDVKEKADVNQKTEVKQKVEMKEKVEVKQKPEVEEKAELKEKAQVEKKTEVKTEEISNACVNEFFDQV